MSHIKIKDLPRGKKISKEEMKRLFGGAIYGHLSSPRTGYYLGSDPYVVNDPSLPQGGKLFGSKWK